MRKLIIQIPAWNEEETLFKTIQDLPRSVSGFDSTEVLVIDDGSTDDTFIVAQRALAQHVIQLDGHRGLAAAFEAGLKFSLQQGATVIVNTDADNQYQAQEIEKLAHEVLKNHYDLVVGDRNASKLHYLPFWKRILYRLAGGVVSFFLGRKIPDPTSGFRALSRRFASEIDLLDTYSYTLETLIQASLTRRKVKSIPVSVNRVSRSSRLIQSTPLYIFKTTHSFLRSLWYYGLKKKWLPRFFLKKADLEELSQIS